MRAVIVATGRTEPAGINDWCPAPMLPLVDRPFVQHLVEMLVAKGVRSIDWILHQQPEQLEEFLGDGERWGAQFRFHLAQDPARPYDNLRVIEPGEGESILLGHADRLPQLEWSLPTPQPVLFSWRRREGRSNTGLLRWTGWALVPPALWRTLPPGVDESGLWEHLALRADHPPKLQEVDSLLSVEGFQELLTSQSLVLQNRFSGLMFAEKAWEPEIYVARSAVIDPSAVLVGPVYVGPNSEIGAACRVGPNLVTGARCIIDRGTALSNSVILPGTYIGEGLTLDGVIADRGRLARVRPCGAMRVLDDCPVGALTRSRFATFAKRALSMTVGAALLVLFAPVLLVVALWLAVTRERVFYPRTVVRVPAWSRPWPSFTLWSWAKRPATNPSWRHFALEFLPALVNVARGELNIVGLPIRTEEEIEQLDADWRSLYLRGRAGIVNDHLLHGYRLSAEERYIREGIQAVGTGWLRDLHLLFDYIGSLFVGARPPSASEVAAFRVVLPNVGGQRDPETASETLDRLHAKR